MESRHLSASLAIVLILSIAVSAELPTADFPTLVRQAKGQVFPSVIFIKVIQETHEDGRRAQREVSGSGVIVSPEGEALTNWHVVENAIEIRCLLSDGRAMEAELLGGDKDTDLALLRLKAQPGSENLPWAQLGDSSELREGDFVIAMGAPWGLNRSVSIGIVSCARRFLPGYSEYNLWVQTDAAISPGNSGGPLVNTRGEVVGITTLGVLIGGNMGFAIPSNNVRHLMDRIRSYGHANWSWTGLRLQPLRDFDRNTYFDATEGVIVADAEPDSPARAAGIRSRDRIVRLNDAPFGAATPEDVPEARRTLGLLPFGEEATLELVRDGETHIVTLVPREKGEVEGEELECPRWDMTVKAINQFENPGLYFYRNEGVFVFGIDYPGNAARAGLRQGDILISIDGREVTTLEDVRKAHEEAVENIGTKHRVLVTVLRSGMRRQVVLNFLRDFRRE